MKNDYKTIKPMKEIPDQLRKLRRQFPALPAGRDRIQPFSQEAAGACQRCRGNLPLRQHGAYQPGDF